MKLLKITPLKTTFIAATFCLSACGDMNGGQNLAVGIGAGAAAREAAQSAGADENTANLVGLAAGLFVVSGLNQQTQDRQAEEAAAGTCVYDSTAVQGTRGQANEERRNCIKTVPGYRAGGL